MKLLRNLLTLLIVACATASAGPINILSGSRCFDCGSDSGGDVVPAWAGDMVEGRWKDISTNTISNHYDPAPGIAGTTGPTCIIASGNGGTIATGPRYGTFGSLISHGGGHADYYGNELYAFDLETAAWSRIKDAFPNPPTTTAAGLYSDGSPAVTHTSQTLTYNPVADAPMVLHVQTSNNFNHITRYVAFDRTSGGWHASSTSPANIAVFGFVAYDSDEHRYWINGGDTSGGLSTYTPGGTHGDSGTWANHGDPMGQFLNAMGAYDPINKIVVFTQFRSSNTIYGFSVNGGTPSARVTLTQSGKPSTGQSHGWAYSPKRQAFLYWNGGGDVYEVKKGSGVWSSATWTWTLLTDGGNSVNPTAHAHGVYGRFVTATYDNREFALTWNSTTGPVSAFEVP